MIELSNEVIMNTYGRFPLLITKGKGCNLWDSDGNEYLDFVSGLAVCNLGHCNEKVSLAVKEQVDRLVHVSNLFYTEAQIRLAKLLTDNSFADKTFFCNSGAEANEAAIKLARKYSSDNFGRGRHEIITMNSSFHGRTMAAITATGQPKFHAGFEPMLEGFSYVPYDDLEALSKAVSERTCAVFLEPIQGEGGVNVPSPNYLRNVRKICDENKLLLMFDEVQTGFGRTGTLFAYEDEGVSPDIMTLAKSMAGGISIGATLATRRAAESFGPGTHASTFGGNPVACAAGIAVMETMLEKNFLDNVRDMGLYFRNELVKMAEKKKGVKGVRGRGFMLGMELDYKGASAVKACLAKGLIINCVNECILRFLPPIVVTKDEIDKALSIIDGVLS